MEYNGEQREVLMSLAKVEMGRQQEHAQVKEVRYLTLVLAACI